MSLVLSIIIKFFSKNKEKKKTESKRFDVVVPLPLCKYCNEEACGRSKATQNKNADGKKEEERENCRQCELVNEYEVLYVNMVEMVVPF